MKHIDNMRINYVLNIMEIVKKNSEQAHKTICRNVPCNLNNQYKCKYMLHLAIFIISMPIACNNNGVSYYSNSILLC